MSQNEPAPASTQPPQPEEEKKKESKLAKQKKKLKKKYNSFKEVIHIALVLLFVLFALSVIRNPLRINKQVQIYVVTKDDSRGYALTSSENEVYYVDSASFDLTQKQTYVTLGQTRDGWRVERPKDNALKQLFKKGRD